jgi:hypothetical protein
MKFTAIKIFEKKQQPVKFHPTRCKGTTPSILVASLTPLIEGNENARLTGKSRQGTEKHVR